MLRLAEAQLYDGQFGLAIENLERAMAEPGLPAELRASLLLRRGQAWDGQKDRERALADYDATIALNVDRASRRAAEQYRKTPFQLVH
jgi:lipoprotein NlpI